MKSQTVASPDMRRHTVCFGQQYDPLSRNGGFQSGALVICQLQDFSFEQHTQVNFL